MRATPGYLHRPLGDWLLRRDNHPVLVVEGARAVGKTTMVRQQFERDLGYGYVNLGLPDTRKRAESDLRSWLRSLPRRVIIDEAQLIRSLPEEIKDVVDEVGSDVRFVLTGSASIARTGLGGADPLTRRAIRRTLHPLTRWEINRRSGSLVDMLFDGNVRVGSAGGEVEDQDLLKRLRVGGFPTYLFPRGVLRIADIRSGIASDLTALLSDEIAPDLDLNTTKARATLDELLRNPGGILNATRVGRDAGMDKRTVERHLNAFGRLFLVQWIPNFATTPTKQSFTRAKIHPVDTSFSVDAFERAGLSVLEDRERYGQILESHVVSEILAARQWADTSCDVGYWRLAQGSTSYEVDLVLVDERGRRVAVEVKSGSQIRPQDTRGIRAYAARKTLHRGYVFYRGDTVQQLESNVWALPMSALGDNEVFTPPPTADAEALVGVGSTGTVTAVTAIAGPSVDDAPDAAIFLSYVHKDDETMQGRIVRFVHDLADKYEFLYGGTIEVFDDRQISWGDDWRTRLSRELGAATFLVAAATPRYLKSQACRDELMEFTAAAGAARDKLLLPLLWVKLPTADPHDPVRSALEASQYIDLTAARHFEPGSVEYSKTLEHVAERLRDTIERRLTAPATPTRGSRELGDEGPDLLDSLSRLADLEQPITVAAGLFTDALSDVGHAFDSMSSLQQSDPRSVNTALLRLAAQSRPKVDALDEATNRLGEAWSAYQAEVTSIVDAVSDMPDDYRAALTDSLEGIRRGLEIPGLVELRMILGYMARMSKHLRPLSKAVLSSIDLVTEMQSAAEIWENTVAGM